MNNFFKENFKRFLENTNSVSIKKELEIICVVAKIVDYDQMLSEKSFEQIGILMNDFYSSSAQFVLNNNGIVDRFCNEHVINYFGVFGKKNDENELIQNLLKYFDIFQKNESKVGFGICYGRIIYGNFGNEKRATVSGFGFPINCAIKLACNEGINICCNLVQKLSEDILQNNRVHVLEHNIK